MNVLVVRSRRARFWTVTFLATALVAVDFWLTAQWFALNPTRDRPQSAESVLVDVILVVATVAYLLVGLPAVQSWTCLFVLATWVAGDLTLDQFGGGAWYVTGMLLSALALPGLIALVLRYPSRRLSPAGRIWVGVSVALTLAQAVMQVVLLDTQRTDWNPPLAGDLDWAVVGKVSDVTRAAAVVPLVGAAVILIMRWSRSRGDARRGFAVLAGSAAFVAVAGASVSLLVLVDIDLNPGDGAAVSSAWWASFIWSFGDAPLPFLVLPLAPLADVAWRRIAAGSVSDHVLAAAARGPGPELDAAAAVALGEPSARVVPAGIRSSPGRRRVSVSGEAGTLAELDVDPEAGYTDDTEHVGSVVDAIRLGLETADVRRRLELYRDEVERSRRRVVEAAALERRRVERDLHDGAQQALLGLNAVLTRASIEPGPERLRLALAEAQSRLLDVLVDLDRLADGLYPEALDRRGLVPALEELADRCPLNVRLAVSPYMEGLPASVESVAWFVVAEALTNAVTHARASSVRIWVERLSATLTITVSDNGRGGVHRVAGGGLAGLRDRVEAAGGSLEVGDVGGGGSQVRAVVPLTRAQVTTGAPPG